jgi:large repetitive protein
MRRTVMLLAAMAVAVLALSGAAWAQTTASADLSVTKTIKPKVVTVGDNQTFTIKITNQRGGTARDVVMTDPLPTNKVRFVRASTSRRVPGSCSASGGVVTCDLGNLRVDRTVTVKILVKNIDAGKYVNRASVSHATNELDRSDNRDGVRARSTRN